MNLLGAIGTLMEGTSLRNTLETVFGENAVVHMMTGKAVKRALRGHLLVDKCLHNQLIKEMMIPKFRHCWIKPRNCTLHFLVER